MCKNIPFLITELLHDLFKGLIEYRSNPKEVWKCQIFLGKLGEIKDFVSNLAKFKSGIFCKSGRREAVSEACKGNYDTYGAVLGSA